MEANPDVVVYSLGKLGYLLVVTPNNGSEAIEHIFPHNVVILDRSGSMGAWTGYSMQAVHGALVELGYPRDDPVSVITFDSVTERVLIGNRNPTISELESELKNLRCRGRTSMSGVIPLLKGIITGNENPAINVIAISDGCLDDTSATIRRANELVEEVNRGSRDVMINATLVRLGSRGDTQALSAFGALCTDQKAEVSDVNIYGSGNEELRLLELKEAIVAGLQNASTVGTATLHCDAGVQRLPTSEVLQDIRLPVGRTSYLLMPQTTDVETLEVLLNGETIKPEFLGYPKDEQSLSTYLEFILQKSKMFLLLGNDISTIVEWASDLQAVLSSVESEAADLGEVGIMARAHRIAGMVRKRVGSVIDSIRALANNDAVNRLNNAQAQADFLRRVDSNRSGKRLARRAGDAIDYESQAQQALASLVQKLGPDADENDNEDDDCVSYFSQATAMESLYTAAELNDVSDAITLSEILQCVGGLGMAFRAPVGNYPDPWSFQIRRIYFGIHLSEPDWSMATQQAVNTGTPADRALPCPGQPDEFISGVITLRSSDPMAFDLYTSREVRPLFECQTSVQMRHMIAPMPGDAIALNTAAIRLCLSMTTRSSLQQSTMNDLIANLDHLIGSVYSQKPYKELYDLLVNAEDPRAWLTGDQDIASSLKPFCVLLRYRSEYPLDRLPQLLRALYYFDCYHAARSNLRGENTLELRQQWLKNVLMIDLESFGTPLQPLFEDEPEEPNHTDQLDLGAALGGLPKWTPSDRSYSGIDALLRDGNDRDSTDVFGVDDFQVIRLVAMVQAVQCSSQSLRVDTDARKALLPDPTTREEAIAWLRAVVRSFYEEDYQKRLAAKRAREEEIRLERLIANLIAAPTIERFTELLTTGSIDNRSHRGFGVLLERVASDTEVPERQEKLALLLIGRLHQDPTIPVWANGNVYTGDWGAYEELFSEKFFGKLWSIRKQFGIHKYRSQQNQHGHGNEFPSYWALGYKDLLEMRAAVPPEEFQDYLRKHCIEKGCCMPNACDRNTFGL